MQLPACPTWYNLRGLGRSPISRMTILIPVIGILILFSNAVNEFISVSAEFLKIETDKAKQISRQNALFLYFGLLIFSVNTLIYNVFCPSVVKEFSTEYEHYDSELRLITEDRASRLQKELNTKFQANLQYDFKLSDDDATAARALGFHNRNSDENREFWLKAKSASVSDLLQKHYKLENESQLGVRRGIFGAYLFSFFLIGIPSVILLWNVLQAFLLI